jgi:hypothetical protein
MGSIILYIYSVSIISSLLLNNTNSNRYTKVLKVVYSVLIAMDANYKLCIKYKFLLDRRKNNITGTIIVIDSVFTSPIIPLKNFGPKEPLDNRSLYMARLKVHHPVNIKTIINNKC